VEIFQCQPVNGLWDPYIAAKCINSKNVAYAGAAIGITQDFIILVVPIPELKALQMNQAKKLNTLALFSIGGL
jgi:hypothetical protein